MKKLTWLMALACVVFGLSSCEKKTSVDLPSDPTDPTNPASIFGLWLEQGSKGDYMRLLTATEEAKEGDFFFGKEWDEGDDVHEQDLKYKGNGWFKWKISGTDMIQIELMDNGGAEIPKTYNVVKLTTTELVLQDPNDKKDQDTWVRVK